ncbi:hypothetical protein P4V95_28075 [Bacillus thuringiensis]|nr:hypothetical protein [Bacillus thuringiensis]
MIKEIPFQEGEIILFKEANLWNDLLERCKKETKTINRPHDTISGKLYAKDYKPLSLQCFLKMSMCS